MEILEVIKWIVAVGAGSFFTVVSQVLFIKPNKRIKDAEADAKETDNLLTRIASLENQCKNFDLRIDKMNKDLGMSYERERALQNDLSISELKRQKNKNAISQGHGCIHVKKIIDCPVLLRQKTQEEEYLQTLKDASRQQNITKISD